MLARWDGALPSSLKRWPWVVHTVLMDQRTPNSRSEGRVRHHFIVGILFDSQKFASRDTMGMNTLNLLIATAVFAECTEEMYIGQSTAARCPWAT